MLEFFQDHQTVTTWLAVSSLLIFIATLLILPRGLAGIPEDYFRRPKRPLHYQYRRDKPLAWMLLLLVKNAIGALFVLVGIALLVLPGQGLLTIVLGLALMNFPGKFRLERWVVSRGPSLRIINHFRRKRGCPELVLDEKAREH